MLAVQVLAIVGIIIVGGSLFYISSAPGFTGFAATFLNNLGFYSFGIVGIVCFLIYRECSKILKK